MYKYTGKKIKPRPYELKAGRTWVDSLTSVPNCYNSPEKLVKGKDYKISYKNNRKAGVATTVITGLRDFSGSKVTQRFLIAPAKVKGLKAKVEKSKRKLTVAWNAKAAKKSGAKRVGVSVAFLDANGKRISDTTKSVKVSTTHTAVKIPRYTKKMRVNVYSYKHVKFESLKAHKPKEADLRSEVVSKTVKLR